MIDKKKLIYFGQLIKKHSELYPSLPLKAEQFESLFARVVQGQWNPNNHNTSEDMLTEVAGMKKPSLKSGIIRNGVLTISSHRTTKYKTLEDKIGFLESRTYDSYVCLSRPDEDKPHKYNLIHFDKKIINYRSLDWSNTYNKKGDHSGWLGVDKGIKVKIVKSMSDQVWINLDMDKVNVLSEYDFTK